MKTEQHLRDAIEKRIGDGVAGYTGTFHISMWQNFRAAWETGKAALYRQAYLYREEALIELRKGGESFEGLNFFLLGKQAYLAAEICVLVDLLMEMEQEV